MLHLAVTYPQGQEIPFEMFTMNGEQIFLVKLLGFVHIPCLYIYISQHPPGTDFGSIGALGVIGGQRLYRSC
jgi:hypothetical protein